MLYLYNECQCFNYMAEFSLSQKCSFLSTSLKQLIICQRIRLLNSSKHLAQFLVILCACVQCWLPPPPPESHFLCTLIGVWLFQYVVLNTRSLILQPSFSLSFVVCFSYVDITSTLGENGPFCLQLFVKTRDCHYGDLPGTQKGRACKDDGTWGDAFVSGVWQILSKCLPSGVWLGVQ